MNARKPIAFFAAMLITAANLYGIATYTSAASDSGQQHIQATTDVITTLPTITVRPTRAQMLKIMGEGARPSGPVTTSASGSPMPYYSFAADTTAGA